MKRFLLVTVLALFFTVPLSADQGEKINLPDGLYMYNSSIEKITSKYLRVGFSNFFVVGNNVIYNSNEAIKKYGSSRINKMFTKNRKYKILLFGNKIGEIYNVKIRSNGEWNYEERLFTENIKEGPMYGRKSLYLERLGSAAQFVAVPEKYEETSGKVYNTITKEEIGNISKLAKTKIYPLIKNRKEIVHNKKCKIIGQEQNKSNLELLDKIATQNNEFYIGIFGLILKTATKGECKVEIAFSVKNNKLDIITSQYDDQTSDYGMMRIGGMLDVDGCGENEIIIEKTFDHEDEAIVTLEIYKQKNDGTWVIIFKNVRRIGL